MKAKFVARIGAVIVLAGTVLACAIDVARLRREPTPSVSSQGNQNAPSSSELARCKALGPAAVDDPACKAAWAKSRERFFVPRQLHQNRPIDSFAVTPDPATAPSGSDIDGVPPTPPAFRQMPDANSDER